MPYLHFGRRCLGSSVGQSVALVKRGSGVRIPSPALFVALAAVFALAAVSAAAATSAASRCHTNALSLRVIYKGAGLGHRYYAIVLRNQSGHSSTLIGYPGV